LDGFSMQLLGQTAGFQSCRQRLPAICVNKTVMMRDARRICKFAKKRRWLKLLPSAPVGLDLRTGKMACLVPGGLGSACLQKASKFFDGNFQILDDGTEGLRLSSPLRIGITTRA
jgi:hypothetical protein